MTKVCIIGGKLQGVEALYLANKAGMETTLIDKSNSPLGKKFCGRFICADVLQYNSSFIELLVAADFVVPALENKDVLAVLKDLAEEYDIRLVYDEYAYGITSSKQISDELMAKKNLPRPLHFPQGKFPYIAKPSGMSGSKGVVKLEDQGALDRFFAAHDGEGWIIEEYLEGPSYSLELIGTPGHYSTYHVTELFMDPIYDCKRVLSCPDFPLKQKEKFEAEAIALGEMVQLHGIMDVEVIEEEGELKILEIDARIPSQTPITVYHATGWNLMAELSAYFSKTPGDRSTLWEREKYVSLEQLLVDRDTVSVLGEHIIGEADILSHEFNFFGADEALTDYAPNKEHWAATMILIAADAQSLQAKREKMLLAVSTADGGKRRICDDFPQGLGN